MGPYYWNPWAATLGPANPPTPPAQPPYQGCETGLYNVVCLSDLTTGPGSCCYQDCLQPTPPGYYVVLANVPLSQVQQQFPQATQCAPLAETPPVVPPGTGVLQPTEQPPGQTPPCPCPPPPVTVPPGGTLQNTPIPAQPIVIVPTQPPIQVQIVPSPTPPEQPQPSGQLQQSPAPPPPAVEVDAETGALCSNWDVWAESFAGKTTFEILQQADILDQDLNLAIFSDLKQADLGASLLNAVKNFLIDAIQAPFIMVATGWAKIQTDVFAKSCPNPQAMTGTAILRGILGWMSKFMGAKSRQADVRYTKMENYLCPVETPGVADANLALMRGNIDAPTWRCWVRMANVHEEYAGKIFLAERELLSPLELGIAKNRKYITQENYYKKLAERGMIGEAEQRVSNALTEFLPPVTDVLHFIVRGIGDPNIVQRFKLLDEFDLLYQGELVKWGEAAGIKKDTMAAYHAAHWVVPGPGQLFTMLQRLRPDNKPANVKADDWEVTSDDINRALRENAYAPFWRPRLEAIAYNPISRRDLIQLFQHGTLTTEQFATRFRDLGYQEANAKLIAQGYEAKILEAIVKEKWTVLYEENAVTREQAVTQLRAQGYTDKLISSALDRADLLADAATRKDCLKWAEREFALGGLSDSEANDLLLAAGVDIRQAMRLLVVWQCRRKARPKEIAASILCKWYGRGLIAPAEITNRLIRVGYDSRDAARLVAECIAETNDKRLAARLKSLKEEQAAAIRAGKAGAYEARQAALASAAQVRAMTRQLTARTRATLALERELARESAAALRESDRANRALIRASTAEERKEARIQAAAEVFAARGGLSSGDAASWIEQAWQNLATKYSLDLDTALEAALLAAHDKRAKDQATYLSLADSAGQAAVSAEQLLTSAAFAKAPQTGPGTIPAGLGPSGGVGSALTTPGLAPSVPPVQLPLNPPPGLR